MKRINCAFHPNQTIVNFCKNSSCLLPMCPNCIKVHSKDHELQNTFGRYQNIQQIYSEVQNNLKNVIKALDNYNEELKDIFNQKQQKREIIKKRMTEYKQKLMNSLQKYINQLQNQIILSLGGQQTQFQEEFNLINRQIQNLTSSIEKQMKLISGQKTLKGLINHFSNNMPQFYDLNLDNIEISIEQFQRKNIQICKQFKLSQVTQIKEEIKQLYKSAFKGVMKEDTFFKGRQSRISQTQKNSRVSIINRGTVITVKAH